MAMTYASALADLKKAADQVKESLPRSNSRESVTLEDAIGRVAASDIVSPISTPDFDTSAMDGYAIRSGATKHASVEAPVWFRVQGTIGAGDDPTLAAATLSSNLSDDGMESSVEIMTGARFPDTYAQGALDACVKVEDTVAVAPRNKAHGSEQKAQMCIAVTKPIPPYANRRFSGQDVRKGEIVLRAGQTIPPSNLMPLASVGVESLYVRERPRVRIWSTGSELMPGTSQIRDVNGVYLTAAGRELGAEATLSGALEDDVEAIARAVGEALESRPADVLVTSGGVSVGKFDHIRTALELNDATIVFHGLGIRPGHPVFFALLPSPKGKVAFFGLPGNPGAAAACFRFLVTPYLRHLMGQDVEKPTLAKLTTPGESPGEEAAVIRCAKTSHYAAPDRDRFGPGVLHDNREGENVVHEVGKHKGPAKLSPFVEANCWIHFRRQQPQAAGQLVDCYAM